jgi:hypothetical protein
MKYAASVFFLLLNFIGVVKAQHDYTKKYYPFINQAELQIIDDKYDDALELYCKAFKSVSRCFSKDYYNATVCAVKAMKYDTAFQFLDSLVVKGTEKSFFNNCSAFQPLKKERKWQIFLAHFDKNHQIALNRQNSTFEKLLKGLDFSDQEFRAKNRGSELYRDTINKIDKHNVKILNMLIEKYGFPSEHLIGRKNPIEEELPGFNVFLNQSLKMSKNKEDFDYTNIQIEAIKKGELDPHDYAVWVSFQGKSEKYLGDATILQLSFGGKKSPFGISKYTLEQKRWMNTKRIELGLESIEEYSRKSIFAIKNEDKMKHFALERYSTLHIFDFDDEEKFKAGFNILEFIE